MIIGLTILCILLFSPLAHGSVTMLPLSIVEFVIYAIFAVIFLNLVIKNNIRITTNIWIMILASVAVIQIVPVQGRLLYFLSPETFEIYKRFGVACPWYTISIYKDATIRSILSVGSYFVLFFVLLRYIDDRRKSKYLVRAVIVIGFIYALYGILYAKSSVTGAFSTFTNRNHFAAYIGMIAPVTVAYLFTEKRISNQLSVFFIGVVQITALILSSSRAGFISFFIGMIFLFWLLWWKRALTKKVPLVIVMIIAIISMTAFIGAIPSLHRLMTLKDPMSVLSGRLEILKDSFSIVKDFPIFGIGIGNFGAIFQKYRTIESGLPIRFSFAHNEPVQLLSEFGIVGFLAFLIFIAKHFLSTLKCFKKRTDPFAIYITAGLLSGVVSIGIHSFFDFVFHVPANSIMVFTLFALSFKMASISSHGASNGCSAQKNIPQKKRAAVFAISCLVIIFFIEVMILGRCYAEVLFGKIKKIKISENSYQAALEYKNILNWIEVASRLNSQNSEYAGKKAEMLSEIAMNDQIIHESVSMKYFSSKEEVLNSAIMGYLEAIRLNPTEAVYHFKLGWLYKKTGKDGDAGYEFQRAILLDPKNKKMRDLVGNYDLHT